MEESKIGSRLLFFSRRLRSNWAPYPTSDYLQNEFIRFAEEANRGKVNCAAPRREKTITGFLNDLLSLQKRQESFLRHLDVAEHFHTLLPFFLLLEKFIFARTVAAVEM